MKIGITNKDVKAVSVVTFHSKDEDIVRSFRIDWSNVEQYLEWADMSDVRGAYIYLPVDDRVPSVTVHTVTTAGETDLRHYSLPVGKTIWWLEAVDHRFSTTGTFASPGRPVKRVLELTTTRQRRLAGAKGL